jgi:hypothetical protein
LIGRTSPNKIEEVNDYVGVRSFEELERECDTVLLELLAMRARYEWAAQAVIATGSRAMKIGWEVSAG